MQHDGRKSPQLDSTRRAPASIATPLDLIGNRPARRAIKTKQHNTGQASNPSQASEQNRKKNKKMETCQKQHATNRALQKRKESQLLTQDFFKSVNRLIIIIIMNRPDQTKSDLSHTLKHARILPSLSNP